MRNSLVGDLLVASTSVEGTVLSQSVCLLVHQDEESAIGLMLNRPLQAVPVVGSQASTASAPSKASGSHAHAPDAYPLNPRLTGKPGFDSHPTDASGNESSAGNPKDPGSSDAAGSSEIGPNLPKIMVVGPQGDPAAGQMLAGKSLHFGGPLSGPVVAVHGSADLAEAEAGEGIFVAAQRDHLEALLRTDQPIPFRLIVGHLGWTREQLDREIRAGVWHRMPATADILSTEDGLLWQALVRRATSYSLSRWLGKEHVAQSFELN